MNQKANFKVLFLRKLDRDGAAKTLGDLALAIMKASGRALVRAGKLRTTFQGFRGFGGSGGKGGSA